MKSTRHVITATAAALLMISSAFAVPRMTISETNYAFGYVPQNSQISHVFWLKSTGEDTLKITKVTPGCGCTKAPLEKETLAPGDSSKLEIIFGTGQYIGHVVKRPKIETNAGAPDQFVEFTANVLMKPDSAFPIVIKPYLLDLSQFGEKLRDRMTFKINNLSDKPLTLTLINAPNELVTVNLPKTIEGNGVGDASVILTKTAYDKEFEKSFTFEINNDNHDRFTVPIKRSMKVPGQADAPSTTSATPVNGH